MLEKKYPEETKEITETVSPHEIEQTIDYMVVSILYGNYKLELYKIIYADTPILKTV